MHNSFLTFLAFALSLAVQSVSSATLDTRTVTIYTCVKLALSNDATRIVSPSDATYPDARTGMIIRNQYPSLIAYATQVTEVQALVACARLFGVQAVPRTGSHHFEAWSAINGSLVIDITHINSVSVSADAKTATVGAGIRLGAFYTALNLHGVTFHAGICPTVGLGGYVGVGGYNMQGRALGMAVDDITSLQIVLATGQLVTANASTNKDLFWAARGGGTYGIIVSITVNTIVLPRSAMVSIQFPNASTRYEVTRKYIDWAPRQPKEFGSQINMYSGSTGLVGWYLGGTVAQLNAILATSGLLTVPGAVINVSGNCSTVNSRNFWSGYTVTTCGNDADAEAFFAKSFNVVQQPFVPILPQFSFNEQVINTAEVQADPWPRANIYNKNYIMTKDKQWSDDTLNEIINRIGQVPPSEYFWAELTSFNITSPHGNNASAFPWVSEAYALFRAEVNVSPNATQNAWNAAWVDSFDTFLLSKMGTASYAGYTDGTLKSNPYTAYYGKNVCNLVKVKKQYDPTNFFRNPQSIPPFTPPGVTC